ncbi:Acyl-CoA N-acyltransferase [Cordyceps fumosorosea ARSEF 2679]|uniref:Acyl-CoA N-acyltransferase n=1 Tax=Cordyceps fumosorosea (strain ARSEF 2679) TaxID=1081104 RepID=A0A167DLA9_CORFA|nr:Acyl-CoA N-acyltransferase [Cordyceps fumosorosea ARSEF 2679]OAA42546.1 Acyl-CoA N-acyltransferase [Cordyceps fumosorosea ARSEF 2679]
MAAGFTYSYFRIPEGNDLREPARQYRDLRLHHRGGGRGKELCKAALDYLGSYMAPACKVLVRLMIKPDNQAIVKLYQSLGFLEVEDVLWQRRFVPVEMGICCQTAQTRKSIHHERV